MRQLAVPQENNSLFWFFFYNLIVMNLLINRFEVQEFFCLTFDESLVAEDGRLATSPSLVFILSLDCEYHVLKIFVFVRFGFKFYVGLWISRFYKIFVFWWVLHFMFGLWLSRYCTLILFPFLVEKLCGREWEIGNLSFVGILIVLFWTVNITF